MPNELTLELLQAHHRCRQTLGYLGLALPMLLVFGGIMSDVGVLPSVSDYYHSALRDLLVGALFATGIVLCTQVRPLRLASSAGRNRSSAVNFPTFISLLAPTLSSLEGLYTFLSSLPTFKEFLFSS
ncbi:MAG: hypothetical protein VX181_08885, partial [Pseudomonadota bacterium]|nr:hypothetical protein [Pseudomonadota bacterium]